MKIGLFFGSFNPIHSGHLIIAEYVANFFTDQIWFVVSPQNPLKSSDDILEVNKRIKLIESAIQNNNKFKISDVELNLPTPSFTIDTLKHLKKTLPEHDYFLIMGSDNFVNIHKWKSSDILLRDYKILIYQRPDFKVNTTDLNSNSLLMKAPFINISATEIRQLIKKSKSIRYLVPEAVIEIIFNKQFYI